MSRQPIASSRSTRPASPKARPASSARRFSPDIIATLSDGKYLRIRAGMGDHRCIGIWVVVVEDRAFVRSWSIKPRSWYRTFLEDPRGAIVVEGQEIEVRARRVTSERLLGLIDRAYLDKYNTKGSLKYARDLGMPKSRATTTELIPA
jgi:hypothetical protein